MIAFFHKDRVQVIEGFLIKDYTLSEYKALPQPERERLYRERYPGFDGRVRVIGDREVDPIWEEK